MGRHEDDRALAGAQALDVLPAVEPAHQADGVRGAEKRPGELGGALADLGGVLTRGALHVGVRSADTARAQVLARSGAETGRQGVDQAAQEGTQRLIGPERQPREQSENEFHGGVGWSAVFAKMSRLATEG